MSEGKNLCLRGQSIDEGLDQSLNRRRRRGDGDGFHREPVSLRLVLPGCQVGRMIFIMHDDFISRLQLNAAADEIVSLTRIARDDDLFRRHIQERCDLLSRFLAALAELRAALL